MGIDIDNGYEDLRQHIGHSISVGVYGDPRDPANIAIECMDCYLVLIDFDRPEEDYDNR